MISERTKAALAAKTRGVVLDWLAGRPQGQRPPFGAEASIAGRRHLLPRGLSLHQVAAGLTAQGI